MFKKKIGKVWRYTNVGGELLSSGVFSLETSSFEDGRTPLHFAAMILLKFKPLVTVEQDLAYPIAPNASIPPSSGKTVCESLEFSGTQLLGIGRRLSFTLTILWNRFVILSLTSESLIGVSHRFSRFALHTFP